MIKRLFVDTGAILAAKLKRDQYHEIAANAWDELANSKSITLVSTEHILDETVTLRA